MFSSSMFKKLLKSLSGKHSPIIPHQGKRLQRDAQPDGNTQFTIKGQGRPGFFIFFGAMFGGIPSIMLFSLLIGSSKSGDGDLPRVFGILFLTPFFLIGASTFLAGLFLWFGKTDIRITSRSVSVRRKLFGIAFQQKEFLLPELELSFEESHRSNDVPSYKLKFFDSQQKIGIGGSLKEEELLWLEREIKIVLGKELEETDSVLALIEKHNIDALADSDIDPNYRSKNLRFTQTFHGWEAQIRATVLGSLGLILFGSIFLFAGLAMYQPAREFLLDLLPAVREALSGVTSSDGEPPVWFAMIFGTTGLIVVLSGIFMLGRRITISIRHSRLFIEQKWLFFSSSRFVDLSDIQDFDVKQTGNVNDDPRYRLNAILKNGETSKIVGFSPADDLGQLQARLRAAVEQR